MINAAAKTALWAVAISVGGHLASSASAIVYDRNSAVAYANANWNKVVTDGYFWINGSTANYYGAGTAVPVNVSGEASGIGDDCAHYVSSCIGLPGATAGGLTIPSRAGTYGEPGAARLDELLVGNSAGGYGTKYQYGSLVSSVSQLTPGDVIGYDWDGSGAGSMSGIDHTAFYVGGGLVDCHATSHLSVNWTLGGAKNYFFVHITLADNIVPNTPTNTLITGNTYATPKLSASTFADGAIGSTQTAAQWQIYQGSTLVYDTGTDSTNLSTLTVPSGKLATGIAYNWKVRYQDNYSGWSGYSTATNFATAIPGDFNGDGMVDIADLGILASHWQLAGGLTQGDASGDGTVDIADLGLLAANWQAGVTTPSTMSFAQAEALVGVPEPTSILALVAAAPCFIQRRRRISV